MDVCIMFSEKVWLSRANKLCKLVCNFLPFNTACRKTSNGRTWNAGTPNVEHQNMKLCLQA